MVLFETSVHHPFEITGRKETENSASWNVAAESGRETCDMVTLADSVASSAPGRCRQTRATKNKSEGEESCRWAMDAGLRRCRVLQACVPLHPGQVG